MSSLTKLPTELLLHILSLTLPDFSEKTTAQLFQCALFIFSHLQEINSLIKEGTDLHIIEHTKAPMNQLRFSLKFFPSQPAPVAREPSAAATADYAEPQIWTPEPD